MKKLAIALALAIVLSLGLSVVANAYVDGVREQYEWNVPKINPENPTIVFDGDVDLEGEWKGAVCVTLDASADSDTYEEVTLWSPAVWGGAYDFASFDEMDDAYKITINTYYLWDDAGLYIASTCDDLTAYNGHLTFEEYAKYYEGAVGVTEAYEYTGMSAHAFEPMIYYTDSNDIDGGYHWPSFYIGTIEGGDAWLDYEVTSGANYETAKYNAENGNPDKDNAIAKKIRSVSNVSAPNAEGVRTWDLEVFLPWEYLNAGIDENGALYQRGELGQAGDIFRIGAIWAVRNVDTEGGSTAGIRVRMSQTQGWATPTSTLSLLLPQKNLTK